MVKSCVVSYDTYLSCSIVNAHPALVSNYRYTAPRPSSVWPAVAHFAQDGLESCFTVGSVIVNGYGELRLRCATVSPADSLRGREKHS